MSRAVLIISVVSAVLALSGCESPGSGSRQPARSSGTPASSSSSGSSSSAGAPIETSFGKVISPAFAADYNGKLVKFQCQWLGFVGFDVANDPNYAACSITGTDGQGAPYYTGVAKDKYDAAAALAKSQKITVVAKVEAAQSAAGALVKVFIQSLEASQ